MPGFFEKSYKQFIPLCITHIYAYLCVFERLIHIIHIVIHIFIRLNMWTYMCTSHFT